MDFSLRRDDGGGGAIDAISFFPAYVEIMRGAGLLAQCCSGIKTASIRRVLIHQIIFHENYSPACAILPTI